MRGVWRTCKVKLPKNKHALTCTTGKKTLGNQTAKLDRERRASEKINTRGGTE